MCSRFEALYDMAANTFRDHDIKFITCNVDLQQKCPEEQAYMMLGVSLGASESQAKEAYQKAYGSDRVTSDPAEAAYDAVYLWKAAVEKAESFEPEDVIAAVEEGRGYV